MSHGHAEVWPRRALTAVRVLPVAIGLVATFAAVAIICAGTSS